MMGFFYCEIVLNCPRLTSFTLLTFGINLITMLDGTCIFYPSERLKHDQHGRPRDKFIYKKFENSKLCPMAATKEYLKRRAEYNVAHTKFFFTTVSPYGPPQKDAIQTFFHPIVADHLPAVKPTIWAWILITY